MFDVRFTVYYCRAIHMADAMKLRQDGLAAYGSAAALLAVHSAIAFSDGLLIELTGKRPRGENHNEAVGALKRACAQTKIESQGIAHLQTLLSVKTDVSYGERQFDDKSIEALCNKADRFRVWAERVLNMRRGRLA